MPLLDLGSVVGPQGIQGPQGNPGAQGNPGPQGVPGVAGITPNIQVGTVTTLDPGSDATVTRDPDSPDAAPVLNFGIPRGANVEDAGDMKSAIYDPTGKAQDIFAYADGVLVSAKGYTYSKEDILKLATILAAGLTSDALPDDLLKWLVDKTNGIRSVATGGTGNANGIAPSATKLQTARTILTNLGITTAASFDGSGNVTPGVTGVLPVAYGGTGKTSLSALASAISPYLSGAKIASGSISVATAGTLTITCPFAPKLVFWIQDYSSVGGFAIAGESNCMQFKIWNTQCVYRSSFSISGNTITFSNVSTSKGVAAYYAAFG